ncbi:MAG: hypothetical protein ACFB51_18875 [Anaerolineae bacterium]
MLNKLHALLGVSAILVGCNLPVAPVEEPTPQEPVAEAPEPAAVTPAGSPTAAATAQSEPDATDAPVAAIPEGWNALDVPQLSISLAHPPGWEPQIVGERGKLDLFETEGVGWLEVVVVDEETAPLYGIADPGAAPRDMLASIVEPASQDGEYGDPQSVSGREDAYTVRGIDDIFSEQRLFGVAAVGDRRVIAIGHIPLETDQAEVDRLFGLFEMILKTVSG